MAGDFQFCYCTVRAIVLHGVLLLFVAACFSCFDYSILRHKYVLLIFFLLLIDRSVLRCTKAKDIFKLCVIVCKDGSLFILFSFGVGDILRESVLVKRVVCQRLLLLILVVVS